MSAVAITTKKDLTPEQAAKLLGKSRRFVIALIKTGELEARNEKAPGSKQNRFRIPPHAPDALRAFAHLGPTLWRKRCRKTPPQSAHQDLISEFGRTAGGEPCAS